MERILARIPSKKISPREVLAARTGTSRDRAYSKLCTDTSSPYLNRLSALLDPCLLMADQILAYSWIIRRPLPIRET